MSNLFVWNIYEKSFTPYWASIAPKHQVHRHQIQRKPSRVSAFWNDSKTKSVVRRSLAYAQEKERVWLEERKRTHPEEFEDEEEEEVVAEEAAAEEAE